MLGPNGAGKTTCIGLLLGLLRVQRGSVRVLGREPDALEVRRRRGAVLQTAAVAPTLRVREHLDLFRSYYRQPMDEARLIAAAGLAGLEDRRFDRLSGGQQRRVMFALALAGDPELVFLDEPTTGLDVEARRLMWAEVRRFSGAGRTVVLTTHYLEEADALADRVVVLHRGRVIAEGAPAEVKRGSGRRVRCVTSLPLEELRSRPEVAQASRNGRHTELLTPRPEALLAWMLPADPSLSELTVSGAGLEEALLALTAEGPGVAA
jgi:ABC-2 type transport system ATP-binding protein